MEQNKSPSLVHKSIIHAIRAYRLEVQAELALPCLSNERLTPPGTRLLMAMLGTIDQPSINKRVVRLTSEIVSRELVGS